MEKKLYSLLSLLLVIFSFGVQAAAFDFKLVPNTVKSASSPGFYTKIPLSPLEVKNNKLDFYKQEGRDYISFEGTYNEATGELSGVFTGATANSNYNSGSRFYCEFKAGITKDQKTTTMKFYPSYATGDRFAKCYAMVVFDFEENRDGGKEEWWPDDLTFSIEPLDTVSMEDSGIRFSDISGLVEVQLPSGYDKDGEPIFDDEEWNYAKLDMPLPYGAKIRLGYKSQIILSTPDMNTFQMKTSDNYNDPNSEVEIILPSKAKKDSVLRLMGGNLWYNLKKMVKDGSMDIEMGQAVAGIKGTTIVLTEDKKASSLKVIEGRVSFRSKATGETVLVDAGEMISATKEGLSAKEGFDVEAEKKKWGDIDSSAKEKLPSYPSYIWYIAALILAVALIVILLKKNKRK